MSADVVQKSNMSTMLQKNNSPVISKRDMKIIDAFANGKTPYEIESLHNVPAAKALLMVKRYLSTQSAITEHEKKQLLLHSAYKFKEVMDNALPYVAEDPKLATNYMRMIEMISKILKEHGEISERERMLLDDAQAKAIVGAVEKAFYVISGFLREEYPEVDINRLNAAFRKAVQEGLIEYDSQPDSD